MLSRWFCPCTLVFRVDFKGGLDPFLRVPLKLRHSTADSNLITKEKTVRRDVVLHEIILIGGTMPIHYPLAC